MEASEPGAHALATRMAPALRDCYGFDRVVIGERLQGGFANDLFRMTADEAALVLRIKHPPAVEEDIAWEHAMVRLLADRLREVSAPLVTLDGRSYVTVEDRVAWLMPFVEGGPADPDHAPHRQAAAAALGCLHRAGTGLSLSPRPRLQPIVKLVWHPAIVMPQLADSAAAIAPERAWAISFVAQAARGRPAASLVHGDYFPGNFLISGDEAAAIVDWEEAQVDWLTWDLANAIGTFCTAGDRLDRDACESFVAAYRAAGGTAPPQEDDLLIPFVRVKRILEILRAPTDREPRWEHQRGNVRSLDRLARGAARLDGGLGR